MSLGRKVESLQIPLLTPQAAALRFATGSRTMRDLIPYDPGARGQVPSPLFIITIFSLSVLGTRAKHSVRPRGDRRGAAVCSEPLRGTGSLLLVF